MIETTAQVDLLDLERRVKGVYRDVARRPQDTYHFEMGLGARGAAWLPA